MHTLKRINRILTALILAMLLPGSSGSLSGTARAACPVTAENWHEVGADSSCGGGISDNSGDSGQPSVAVAPDGRPYVAWEDKSSGNDEIYLRRWSGSSWEEVGAGSATGGGISNSSSNTETPSLAIAPDGTPYIAWSDARGGNMEIYVRRWSGSSWEEVGTGSASGGGISDDSGDSSLPSIAVAPDGTPYVAWNDGSAGNLATIYIRRWNGSSWQEVGAGSASGQGISGSVYSGWPSVAVAPDGRPYVAWHHTSGGDYEIYVRRWEGGGPRPVLQLPFNPEEQTGPCAFSPNSLNCISSLFDHEYPLLPPVLGGTEPTTPGIGDMIMIFNGDEYYTGGTIDSDSNYGYSGHDAIDFRLFLARLWLRAHLARLR
jgi:hypothetical protein